jgi:hypothetical protein
MLNSESLLNRCQAQAGIALDDDAADTDSVKLTRRLLRKTAHARKMMVAAAPDEPPSLPRLDGNYTLTDN